MDAPLEAVLAPASMVMTCRSKTGAHIGQEVSERVVPHRLARMREAPTTYRDLGYLAKQSPSAEGKLGDQVVGTSEIVASLPHAEADHITGQS